MSKIDYQKLREIAEKTKIAGEAPVMPFDQRINALNDFMKHFSPDIALALLDEVKRLEDTNIDAMCRIAELESNRATLAAEHGIQIAYKFLKRNGFKVCFHDRFVAVTSTGEQPDAMGFRNSASCLIEAKCSRADLLADRKKRFRKNPSLGMGDWRFFISEPGIISVEDLPPGWGLLHVVNGRVRKVHGWPKGNCCWGNPDDKPFTGNKQVECDYMLSALRRMELRGHLNEIYDGVIVNKKEGNAA